MTIRFLFRCMGWLLLAAMLLFTLSPIELRPTTSAPADLERFLAFVAVGGALCVGYPRHGFRIALLLLGMIGLLEVAQNLVPTRHGHIHDSMIKALGVVLGTIAAALIDRGQRGVRVGLTGAVPDQILPACRTAQQTYPIRRREGTAQRR